MYRGANISLILGVVTRVDELYSILAFGWNSGFVHKNNLPSPPSKYDKDLFKNTPDLQKLLSFCSGYFANFTLAFIFLRLMNHLVVSGDPNGYLHI